MTNEERRKLREICCEERSDIIKGHRLTDLESKIFHGWVDILNGLTDEELEFISTYKSE